MAADDSTRPASPNEAIVSREEDSGSIARRPPEWLGTFMQLQTDELRLRGEELTATKEQNARGHEYAIKAPAAYVLEWAPGTR